MLPGAERRPGQTLLVATVETTAGRIHAASLRPQQNSGDVPRQRHQTGQRHRPGMTPSLVIKDEAAISAVIARPRPAQARQRGQGDSLQAELAHRD